MINTLGIILVVVMVIGSAAHTSSKGKKKK